MRLPCFRAYLTQPKRTNCYYNVHTTASRYIGGSRGGGGGGGGGGRGRGGGGGGGLEGTCPSRYGPAAAAKALVCAHILYSEKSVLLESLNAVFIVYQHMIIII